jgi:hypothetical protein
MCNFYSKLLLHWSLNDPPGKISGSHGGEYEDGCLLECRAV